MGHHHHHHSHDDKNMSLKDKLKILVKHWKEHNDSHLSEYEKWEKKAKEEDLIDVAELLKEVCHHTQEISKIYEEIEKLL